MAENYRYRLEPQYYWAKYVVVLFCRIDLTILLIELSNPSLRP